MALLNMPRTTPPVPPGFAYTQMETSTRIQAEDSLGQLIDLVIAHRKYKGLTPTDEESVSKDVQRQICSQMPPGWCRGEPGEDYKPFNDLSRTLTLDKITSFSRAVFAWVTSGDGYVDEEEATRRAKICLACPFNKEVSMCNCSPLWEFLQKVIPPRRRIANLHACGICGCMLQAKVLAPENVVRESNKGRDLSYPVYCWAYDMN
jgi:hypothetical protein